MDQWSAPSADEFKLLAIDGDLDSITMLATSGVLIFQTLINAGQAVKSIRIQVEVLQDARDPISLAIREAHEAAEAFLDRCAQAAHMVAKDMFAIQARRSRSKFN